MTTWADAYDRAVDAFGQVPGRQLEQQLADAYRKDPESVQKAFALIGVRYSSGKIHSPWPLVLDEVKRAEERRAVQPDKRAKQIRQAETWIRNTAGATLAGEPVFTLADESIIAAYLFDDTGLVPHADQQTRDRLLAMWRSLTDAASDDLEQLLA